MNPAVFFENFELLADAPNGVQKLREMILQLAVMGKLVEQDPNDEPACFLLERIKTEKGTEKRKSETLLPIKENEIPFEIPMKWALCRLGEIIQLSSGDALPSHKMDTDGKIPVYGGNGVTGYHSQSNVSKPSIVIGRVGYYCGSVHITPNLAWITDNAFNTYFSESNIYLKFLFWLLKSANLGIKNNSTAQPVISGRKVYPTVLAIPPLAEQKRIVAKVDELMALCDKLEARRQKKQELQIKLNSAALDKMLSSENQEVFEQHWQRICENFDLLYDNPENVEKLRKAIIQLAVHGKLVEQNPEDEPASVLIEKIEMEKGKYVKKREIGGSKSVFWNGIVDEKESPNGWKNLVLGSCIELISDTF